jgi:uncharacterized protein YuzE
MPRQTVKPRTKLKRHDLAAQFTYDDEADAAYIYLNGPIPRGGATRTREVVGNRDVYLDFDENGRLLGIEIIDWKHLPAAVVARIDGRPQ